MVTVTRDPDRYRVLPGEGYDGVVQVAAEGFYGSGVLLNGGRAILTSAHLLAGAENVAVRMDMPGGPIQLSASKYAIHPDYDPINSKRQGTVTLDELLLTSLLSHFASAPL
ncbi:MAG: hypothetical protein ABR558_10080 [Thioalkalivibrio sp.]